MKYSETALQRVREDRLLIDEVDRWLYEEIAPNIGQRILEIGRGFGNFAQHFVDRELYVGTDVSQESVAHVQSIYRLQENIDALVADVTDDDFRKFADYQFDTIFSLNVFEHIEDEHTALQNAEYVLKPGGTIILVVPAHDWLYGTIDSAIGHYRRYDKGRMEGAWSDLGMKCISQKYINALGAVGWYVSGRLFRKEVPPSSQLRMFNKLVPILKRSERLVKLPFGISLLTVAGKSLR